VQRIYRLIIPDTIEAVKVTSDTFRWAAKWCRGVENVKLNEEGDAFKYVVTVPTLYGAVNAFVGDYIFKTAAGDFHVMGGRAFEDKYELSN